VNPRNFFAELKRRNVYNVAVAYAVVGWLLVQVATQVFPFFEIPNWAVQLVVLLIMIGFPIALVIAWAFELTPEGIKRTDDVAAPHQRGGGRTWILVVAAAGLLSLALFFAGRYTAPGTQSSPAPTAATPIPEALPAKSIAVLPFQNLSKDEENAFFADGVQDLGSLRLNPDWDPLRSHPRFERLAASLAPKEKT